LNASVSGERPLELLIEPPLPLVARDDEEDPFADVGIRLGIMSVSGGWWLLGRRAHEEASDGGQGLGTAGRAAGRADVKARLTVQTERDTREG
jgi:hypothetical protein